MEREAATGVGVGAPPLSPDLGLGSTSKKLRVPSSGAPVRDTWLTDLLERASNGANDGQSYLPSRARDGPIKHRPAPRAILGRADALARPMHQNRVPRSVLPASDKGIGPRPSRPLSWSRSVPTSPQAPIPGGRDRFIQPRGALNFSLNHFSRHRAAVS